MDDDIGFLKKCRPLEFISYRWSAKKAHFWLMAGAHAVTTSKK
jgi:hypothetical protein